MRFASKIALTAATLILSSQTWAQITFYEHDGWRGRTFKTNEEVRDLSNVGFNDRASSVVVDRGQWEVCENSKFHGNCMVLRVGSYDSLRGMGMNDKISSVRPLERSERYRNEAPAPLLQPTYEYRRRPNEETYQAPVTSVRAVYGASEQRCWMEHVSAKNRNDNVGGAVVGAILGGVLGHQIGGGRGRDIATAGGAIAGATLGSNVGGNNGGSGSERDVRRCEAVPDSTPGSWDVTYNYRGTEHRIQMSSPPGRTIEVNHHGEPRQ